MSSSTEVKILELSSFKKEEDDLCSLPPENFYHHIADEKVARSQDCCFVLYCMSTVHLNSEVEDHGYQPFELFKDCYNRNKKVERQLLLQRYFSVQDVRRPLGQDLEDVMDGSTFLSMKSEGDTSTSEMSVYPTIMLFGKTNEFLSTKKHIKAYERRFQMVLEKYNSKKLPHLYANWLKLMESYVEFAFRDLTIKWCQWLHSIRAVGQRHSVRTSLDRLLPKMCNQFWKNRFLFQHSLRRSIGSLSSLLIRRAYGLAKGPSGGSGSAVSFGLWVDSVNGILIFANGTAGLNGDAYETSVTPACGVCLDEPSPHVTIRRLMLFLNFAIIESFIDEVR